MQVIFRIFAIDMNKIAFYLLIAVAAMCGCTSHGGHGHDHEHEGEEHHHADEIVLEPEKAKAAGVRVETIKAGDFHGVISTSGRVMAASCDETTIVATQSGRVRNIGHISEGVHLSGGTRVFTIVAADMRVAEGDPVQRALIAFEKAKRDYERAELLVRDKIISEKDFAVAKAEYESAQLVYRSLADSRSAGGVVVTTPKAGYVKQCLVSDGDYVEAGQPLMILTQNQHLYLRAEVPERHWNEMSKIVCAKFRTSYSERLYDITDMGGHIQSYGRSAESGSAYIPVIFEFNNTGDVVQGSYAEIYLITGKRSNVITVPVSAITEEQGVHYIYIKVDEEGYRKQEVKLGMSDGDRTEILKGLKGGEQVVVKGAIQVKLAASANVIPAHTHNH